MSSLRVRMPPSRRANVRPQAHGSTRRTTTSPVRYRMAGLAVRPRLVTTSSPGVPSGTGLPGRGVHHLAEERVFVQVQRPRRFPALEADRSDLGQAVVIQDPRAPRRLDARPRGRDVAARLAGDDQRSHRAGRQRALGPLLAPPPRPGAARRWACSTRPSAGCRRSSSAARAWTCRRPARSAAPSASRPRSRPRSRGTARTRTGRTRGRRARCAPPGRRPSSSRASTASCRWCRASGAACRWWTTSGSSACRRSSGSVRLVPHGAWASWSATSSALVVNGSRARSSGSRRLRRSTRAALSLRV